MARKVTIYRSLIASPDTSQYARAAITSKPPTPDIEAPDLDMAVRFTFDRITYYVAAWVGTQAASGLNKVRTAELLMTDANLPANGMHTIFARVTDNPEAPIINAGTLQII